LKAQSLIGGMAVTVAIRAGTVTARKVKGTKDRIDTPQSLFGFEQQGLLAVVAHERLERGQSLRGGAQDGEHELPGLDLQEFLKMAQSDARVLE
jgi:hypothetical protein